MIRVSVFYPNGSKVKFDHEYYAGQHLDLVKDRLGSKLVSSESNKGLGGGIPGSPAPFVAVGHLVFNSMEDFQSAFGQHGQELMGDIPNFTNVEPQVQVSEITS
tara:strand:- start:762 stop:1073 length:312 start_codon:yes stop_codon:yes gene_type:complete